MTNLALIGFLLEVDHHPPAKLIISILHLVNTEIAVALSLFFIDEIVKFIDGIWFPDPRIKMKQKLCILW